MSIETKAKEYEDQIQAKLKERQEIDDEISRLQNIHNNLSKRDELLTDLRRQIKQNDVKYTELYQEVAAVAAAEEPKKKSKAAGD